MVEAQLEVVIDGFIRDLADQGEVCQSNFLLLDLEDWS